MFIIAHPLPDAPKIDEIDSRGSWLRLCHLNKASIASPPSERHVGGGLDRRHPANAQRVQGVRG